MKNESLAKLMAAIPFTEDDLQLNRNGKLSQSQRSRLSKKIKHNFVSYLLIFSLGYIGFPFFFGPNKITLGLDSSHIWSSVWGFGIFPLN